jgi:hypothetical protein
MDFIIRKDIYGNWWHDFNNDATKINISDFEAVIDSVANTFIIQCKNGSNVPTMAISIANVKVINQIVSNTPISFSGAVGLKNLLTSLGYTPYIVTGGGGGGAVDSVNGQTGVVVIPLDYLPLAGGTMDEDADIFFDNGSKLSEGLYDEGTFGNKGIARTCAVGYEDKWEAGEQYITETTSGIIQFRRFAFNVPTVDDDGSKRYAVGSYWQMRNNDIYICTDPTNGAAVWDLYSVSGIPTLQQVTDEGATTTNDITVSKETGTSFIQVANNNNTLTLQVEGTNGSLIELNDANNDNYGSLSCGELVMTSGSSGENIQLNSNYLSIQSASVKPLIELNGTDGTLTGSVQIKTDLIDGNYTQQLPDKSGTFAMLDDVPTKTSDLINDGDNGTSHFISLEDLPSTLTLYPTTAASGIGGYNKLVSSITDPDYNITAVDVSTGAITGTDQLIAGLITEPNIIIGNPGVFNMTTLGNIRKTNGSGAAEFFFRVYKRTSGGTETLILQSSDTPQITSAIYTEFNASGLWNDGIFLSTDRIVIKFYGTKVGGGSNPTYDFQFGGAQPIRSIVPVPLNVLPVLSLDELTNVTITGVTNNQLLSYTSATDIWENKSIASILGYSPIKKIVSDTVSSSAVTGVTTETLCKTYTISANTFADGDFMKVLVGLEKTGVVGTATARIRVNQTNNFATATLVGTYTASAGSHTAVLLKRDFLHFKSGVLKGISFNTNNQSDLAAGASILYSTTTLSPTSDFFIYVSVINANAGDSTIVNQVQITN